MIYELKEINLNKKDNVEYGFIYQDRPDVELLGWAKHPYKNYPVNFIRCTTCEKDPELFGSAIFWSTASDLNKQVYPCGCAKHVRWTEHQWKILAKRKCEQLGFEFVGWAEDYNGAVTLCELSCPTHGIWRSNRLSNLVKLGRGCPSCGAAVKSAKMKLQMPVTVNESNFFATGKYHPDTVFTHIGKRDTTEATYWRVDCPVCGMSGECQSGKLKLGTYCCGCSNFKNQTEAYINIVRDGNIPVAIKFGISFNSKVRVKSQNYRSVYEVENKLIFDFPDLISTRKAERDCKNQLVCGVIPKEYMPDGYSETTHSYNIEKVINIYKANGGVQRLQYK